MTPPKKSHGGRRAGAGHHLIRVKSLLRECCYLVSPDSVEILKKMTADGVRVSDYAELWFLMHDDADSRFAASRKRVPGSNRVKHNVSLSEAAVAVLAEAPGGRGRALDTILADYENFVARYGRPVPVQFAIPEKVFAEGFSSDRLRVQRAVMRSAGVCGK